MNVAPLGNLPYCKGLWSVISGTTCRCDLELVQDEIKNASTLLQEGLRFFKKYSDASLQNVQKTDPPPRMYDLVSKLAPLLDLDAMKTWDLVCNFMLYEYRNCAETFASQLSDLSSMRALIEDIWNFYYSERVTLIKCLKLMLEYRDNKRHPYQAEFINFFEEALFGTLSKSVQSQIEELKFINPPIRSQLFTDEHLHQLYNSSLVEMRELLHVFTIILHEVNVAENEFSGIYASIAGQPRRLISTKSHEDKEIIEKKLEDLQYSQVALLLVGLDVTKHDIEDWIKGVRKDMQDLLEHKCIRDCTRQDGPLFLAWMLANYAIEPDNLDVVNNLKPFGIKAIQLDVFHYLQKLTDSEMVKEETQYAHIVRSSVYNLLSLIPSFIEEDRIGSLKGVFDAIASVIKFPEIAERFWRDQDLWMFYKYSVEQFPYKFEPLTVVAIGLASASARSAKKIAAELDDLPSVTLETPRHRDSGKLWRPYEKECTIYHNAFAIPIGCSNKVIESTANDKDVVLWHIKARYWDAFHYKLEQLIFEASSGISNVSEGKAEQVCQGFKLLEILLSADVDIPRGMVIPTEFSFEIINRFAYPVLPLNIYRIIARCICISSKLVLKYPEDILSRMRTGVYPRFNNWYQKTSEFAEAVSFDGGLIASWLSGIETIEHTYPILTAYLDILSNYLLVKYSREAMYSVEIPGMVFLLQGVLPKLDSWYFASDTERIDIWLKSMYCLHRALDANLPKGDPSGRAELQLIVAYNLMYLEPRHALLRLVRTGERTLQNKMTAETDWVAGRGFKIIKSVQLALSVVNRLLMFRKRLGLSPEDRSPLEVALYASPCLPNGLLIVPTIVDYLYVWFSPSLQAMAVRLLKKFAEGFSMSLLVCMGMDGTAIRETFASRLMSPTCAAEVKVAILELVAVCLERQPGLTEALFNIMHQAERRRIFPRPADEFLTVGCSQFLDLYLKRIHREEDIVYDRLFSSTMNLLRAMWYHRNEILVNFFRKRANFWTHLLAPLFRELVPGTKGYSQLIDIVTLELFENSVPESDFVANLERLVAKKEGHLERLARFVLDGIPRTEVDSVRPSLPAEGPPLHEANLESWYHFIVTLTDERFAASYPIEESQAHVIVELSLDSLLARLKEPVHEPDLARILTLLASLSLRCVTAWKHARIGKSLKEFRNKLTELLQEIVQSYRSYGKLLRQTLVSLVLECVRLVEPSLEQEDYSQREEANSITLEYLLTSASLLASYELEELKGIARDSKRVKGEHEEKGQDESAQALRGARECIPASLTVCLVTQVLHRLYVSTSLAATNRSNEDQLSDRRRRWRNDAQQQDAEAELEASKERQGETGPVRWFRKASCVQLRQMIPELTSCTVITLQRKSYLRFSRAALAALGAIARSPYGSRLLGDDSIVKLWLSLVPPKDIRNSMLDSLYDDFAGSHWRCQDWWPLYTLGLEFLTGLVTAEISILYTQMIVTFLGSHEYQLMEVSTLLRHTADPLAAELIQSLVSLVSALASREVLWNSIQPSVRETLIKCMYLAYDSTVNLLLRPRILKFIIDGISVESAEELQSCDEKLPSRELELLVNKLIVINAACAQSFVRFSPKLNALLDTIYTQNFWYTPLAEMNFGPPQMSMCSGPRLTYGTIISSVQLFTQALSSRYVDDEKQQTVSGSRSSSEQHDQSVKRQCERAQDPLRRAYSKDPKAILPRGRSALVGGGSSSTNLSVVDTSYSANPDVSSSVPLLSSPRLVRRPYDPLICENTILSRATALVANRRLSKGGSPSGQANGRPSNPWFASMEENNTRLALEINLVLILCQALEGVRSPRLAFRDRQLIARETASEVGVFFDFLEHQNSVDDWQIEGSLVTADGSKTRRVRAPDMDPPLPARLVEDSTVCKVPVCQPAHFTEDEPSTSVNGGEDDLDRKTSRGKEYRLDKDVVTTGGFDVGEISKTVHLLPLLAKLFKSIVETLDSTQYG
ncbi:nucleoporin NUP188 homolog isoform X2 [Orussus abietinus]|uniref:nucleoporin NUP188 homolog isoform X2 n=1 Tax=Orussus abietinus TaxID=222816 RepID=UPI000625002B|nr:nucleoporin NUP188 homolog isoform X2 [Orussus abietinus]